MANQIIRALYVSNNGTNFAVGVNAEVASLIDGAAASLIGYAAAPAGLLPLPRQMKPRRAVVFNAAGRRREVILLSSSAPLATGTSTTIALEDSDGASSVYTVDEVKNESARKRRKVAAV
jgi:hypothetical protein